MKLFFQTLGVIFLMGLIITALPWEWAFLAVWCIFFWYADYLAGKYF